MSRWLISIVIILLFVALGFARAWRWTQTDEPAYTIDNFAVNFTSACIAAAGIEGAAPGSADAYCRCVLAGITRVYTLDELVAIEDSFEKTGDWPSTFDTIVGECADR